MSQNIREEAKRLASRPYITRIIRDDSVPEEPLFVALNPELEGCMAQGTTVEEAEANLNDFRIDYIEHLLEHNLPVQPPASKVTSITGIVNKDAVVRVSLEESILKPIDEADIQRDDHETIVLPM